MCSRWAPCLLTLGLLLSPADLLHAGEGVQGVDRAVRALAQDDQAALARVAGSKHGDVWVVVERLLARGEARVARSLAARAPSPEDAALTAYVVRRQAEPLPQDVLVALDRVQAARRARDGKAARAVLASVALPEDGVAGVLHLTHRMYLLEDPVQALDAGMTAARVAAALGWMRRHSQLLRTALQLAHRTKQNARTIELGTALLAAAGNAPPRALLHFTHQRLARAYRAVGRHTDALASARSATSAAGSPRERRDALRFQFILDKDNPAKHEVYELLQSLRRIESELGNASGVAATDVHLATFDAYLGRWPSAIEHVARALAWFDEHGKPWERRGAHLNAALVALELLDPERALRHLATAREAGAGLTLDDTSFFSLEAAAHMLREDYAGAERAYRVVLGRHDRVSTQQLGATWINLATVLLMQERLADADAALQAADAVVVSGGDVDLRIRWLAARSRLAFVRGDAEAAESDARGALRLAEEHMQPRMSSVIETSLANALLSQGDAKRASVHAQRAVDLIVRRSAALPEQLGAQYRSELRGTFGLAIEAALAAKDLPAFFRTAERARAVALRHRLGGAGVTLDLLEPELRRGEERLRVEETLAVRRYRAAVAARDTAAAKSALAELARVRERLDRHRDRMHARQAAAAQLVDPQVDTLAATQSRLTASEAQVHFASVRGGIVAVVITRDDARSVPIGSSASLAALLDGLALEDPTSAWQASWAALRRHVVEPLAIPAGITRLTVIPAGRLDQLPFAALWPGKQVALVPSATIARLLAAGSGPAEGVLAVGDPTSPSSPRLPGAAAEARHVGDVTLVGKDASEAGVRAALARKQRWRVVHYACHAQINPRHPLRSALGLAPAGADDGLWTVAEILSTRVPAELVVLAACSSAQGRTFEQEGRVGFVHGFFVAGATRVLASLWDVDDRATAAFVERFHAALREGVAPAEALRTTQAWMRAHKAWSHPAHWAGWQLWGPPAP